MKVWKSIEQALPVRLVLLQQEKIWSCQRRNAHGPAPMSARRREAAIHLQSTMQAEDMNLWSPCFRILAIQTSLASKKDYSPPEVACCHGQPENVSGRTSENLHISRVYNPYIQSCIS